MSRGYTQRAEPPLEGVAATFQKRGRSPADGEHDEDHDLCFGTGNWKSGGRPAGFFLCGEAAEGTYGRAEGRVLPNGGSPLRADAGIL